MFLSKIKLFLVFLLLSCFPYIQAGAFLTASIDNQKNQNRSLSARSESSKKSSKSSSKRSTRNPPFPSEADLNVFTKRLEHIQKNLRRNNFKKSLNNTVCPQLSRLKTKSRMSHMKDTKAFKDYFKKLIHFYDFITDYTLDYGYYCCLADFLENSQIARDSIKVPVVPGNNTESERSAFNKRQLDKVTQRLTQLGKEIGKSELKLRKLGEVKRGLTQLDKPGLNDNKLKINELQEEITNITLNLKQLKAEQKERQDLEESLRVSNLGYLRRGRLLSRLRTCYRERDYGNGDFIQSN